MTPTYVTAFADRLVRRMDVSTSWTERIKHTARKFSYWHVLHFSHQPDVSMLNEYIVSDYLAHAMKQWAKASVKTERGALLRIWTEAAREGLCRKPDREMVRGIRLPEPCPSAWSAQQVERLLQVAERLHGRMVGYKWTHPEWKISRAKFWRAAILFGYDTALRRGDCMRVTVDAINWAALTIQLVQAKTGKQVVRPLSNATREALDDLPHPNRLLLPWPGALDSFSATFRRDLVNVVDLPGSWLWLRRTSATEIAILSPGAESQALGHTDGRCRIHYVDKSRAQSPGLLPTPLN